jgi:hypothetical protein
MSFSDRPPLNSYTCEKIDADLHEADTRHWPQITAMRVKTFHPLDEPVPPQRPEHLLLEIKWYARSLFRTEADYYEPLRADPRYGAWLVSLADRIVARVMKALARLEKSGTNALERAMGIEGALILGYHGLTTQGVEEELQAALLKLREQYEQPTSKSEPVASVPSNAAMVAAYDKIGVDLSSAPPLVKMAHAAHVAAQRTEIRPAVRERMSASIHSPSAAAKMKAYMEAKALNQTEFAIKAGTTDKTIRKFRQTGKVKRSILSDIAKAMGTTKEELLSK